MTILPGAGQALVPSEKISGYLLNPSHPRGRSKCRFFSAFGFLPDEPHRLGEALKTHAVDNQVTEVIDTAYGRRYVVECSVRSPDTRNPCIVSLWQENEAGVCTLVTAYPAQAGRRVRRQKPRSA